MKGYNEVFLGDKKINLPVLSEVLKNQHFKNHNQDKFLLDYVNFSLLHSPERKFPIYTAANINGNEFHRVKRASLFGGSDRWEKDERIDSKYQYGLELYRAAKSDFDRGHLTKREDVQWGCSEQEAISAAKSTFFYTNSVPQMAKLNRGIWKDIEDYILHEEAIQNDLKIVLFTGPFLNLNDPNFVTQVNDNYIKLPTLFWKVIYYLHNNNLYKTGFVAGQKNLLVDKGVIEDTYRGEYENDLFQGFKDSETYQVQTNFIEELSGLKFLEASENYTDERPTKLILQETDVRDEIEISPKIINITL